MKNGLIIYDQKPLTAEDIKAQVQLIQEVMKGVMQEGEHYGKIPGCGPKPTLLKPGAEKLITTFNLCPDFDAEDLSSADMVRYRVKCNLQSMSGKFVGSGVGECSSEEEKYKWREAINEQEWNETPEDRRRERWKKGYQGESDYKIKQIRTNPFDLANTILKMAKKRALVDATLTRTAASDIFTQDIEDIPDEYMGKDKGKGEKSQPLITPEISTENKKAYMTKLDTFADSHSISKWWIQNRGDIKITVTEQDYLELEQYKEIRKRELKEKK